MSVLDHEKLNVYQRSLDFVRFADSLLETIPKRLASHDQLERAATSIPLNIAEGDGKFTAADRCRFFDIASGSALGCAAVLDVLLRKGVIEPSQANEGKEILRVIVAMLVGLICNNSTERVHEEQATYNELD